MRTPTFEELFRDCQFRAHSGAVAPMVIETGAAAWMPLGEIGIP